MRKLLVILSLGLAAVAYADVTPGEAGVDWRPSPGGTGKAMEQASVAGGASAEFDNLVEGAARGAIFQVVRPGTSGGPQVAVLERVVVTSTNCVDCDMTITVTSGDGSRVVYSEDGFAGLTVPPVADGGAAVVWPLYSNVPLPQGGTTVLLSATGDVLVTVTNNDAEATNDEDVTVRLFWRSAR